MVLPTLLWLALTVAIGLGVVSAVAELVVGFRRKAPRPARARQYVIALLVVPLLLILLWLLWFGPPAWLTPPQPVAGSLWRPVRLPHLVRRCPVRLVRLPPGHTP